MKGLNIKKVVAIGIGAALVGSALAPVVSAANMVEGGLDGLARDNIVDDMGAPVVDVVVGSGAAVSDVVWAGNIAAKVAQLATTSTETAAGEGVIAGATVDLTVGGQSVVSGVGNTDKNTLDFRTGVHEFMPIKATNGDIPLVLADESSWEYKWSGDTTTIALDENIVVNGQVMPQTDGDGILAGELVMDLDAADVAYTLGLGAGIPYPMTDDSNSSTDITVKLLGKTYQVRETTGTKIVLRTSETSQKLIVGEELTVNGIGSYADSEVKVRLLEISQDGAADAAFESEWELLVDGVVKATATNLQENADLKDEFSTYTDSSVIVDVIASGSDNTRYARTISGDDQLEIRNGQEFPYDSSASSNDPEAWEATITNDGTNRITKVEIKNKDLTYDFGDADASDLQGSGNDMYKMGPLAQGGEIDIAGRGAAKFIFSGLEANNQYENTIGNEELSIRIDGTVRTIPLVISLGEGSTDVDIAGQEFTVDVNDTDDVFRYWETTVNVDTTTSAPTASIAVAADTNSGSTVNFDLSTYENYTTVNYQLLADNGAGDYWLVLAADQTFTVDNDATSASQITFHGTQTGETNPYDGNGGARSAGFGADIDFYLPDRDELNVLTTLTSDKNLTGNEVIGDEDNMYQAIFTIDDDRAAASLNDAADVNVYLDTSTGMLIDAHNSSKTKANSAGEVVYSSYWTIDTTATSASELLASGTTMFGSEFEVADSVLTFSVPNEKREVSAFLGGYDTSSSVEGGANFTGLIVGNEASEGSTNVTVTAVDGTCSVEGGAAVSVVAVPSNLVKVDASTYGKSIIVGGFAVNTAAQNLEISDGQTLDAYLTAEGEYVAAVLTSGNIVVAGYSASDTGSAAADLINALEALI
jgi:hypothetical protein